MKALARPLLTCALILVASATVLAGCSDDDGDEAGAVPTQTAGRWCDLWTQLDQATLSTGAASAPAIFDGPPEAFAQLRTQFEAVLGELEEAASDDVDQDTATVVVAFRRAGDGDLSGVQSPAVQDTASRLTAYAGASCPDTGTSGEG